MEGRTYGDPCGVARALDVVGERWALLVVRELLLGPKRFSDLHRGLAGMSQNVLSQRLRELERVDIVRRRRLGPPAGAWAYELTERGAELEPILIELGRWGRHVPLPEGGELSVDAFILALKTTLEGSFEASIELRVGDDQFVVEAVDGRLSVVRGSADRPDAVIAADVATLRQLAFGGARVADAAGVEGDADVLQRVFEAFSSRRE
jgi:DNA-binding HxlR family transcriptional regulator